MLKGRRKIMSGLRDHRGIILYNNGNTEKKSIIKSWWGLGFLM